jgi:hypothetical protein
MQVKCGLLLVVDDLQLRPVPSSPARHTALIDQMSTLRDLRRQFVLQKFVGQDERAGWSRAWPAACFDGVVDGHIQSFRL